MERQEVRGYFFEDVWRMDWGFGNPNKTAALIAMLMVAVWVLASFRKWGFWPALLAFTALGCCLIHTFSRGGIVAAAIGILPVIIWSKKPWKLSRIFCVTVSAVILSAFAIHLNATERLATVLPGADDSVANRLILWNAAPQMMLDAPGGWGLGNAGNAFMQWYQPVDQLEGYRTLVNSHLTWLVEMSWVARFGYILAWIVVLGVCFPERDLSSLSIAFGIWLSFGVSATFSSVAESAWLWLLPALALIFATTLRIYERSCPNRILIASAPIAGVVVMALIIGWTWLRPASYTISHTASGTIVGKGEPSVIVRVDQGVMGENYGKTWRKAHTAAEAPTVLFSSTIPAEAPAPVMVLAGQVPASECALIQDQSAIIEQLILLNPDFSPEIMPDDSTLHLDVVFGEFYQSRFRVDWLRMHPLKKELAIGQSRYLHDWPRYIMRD